MVLPVLLSSIAAGLIATAVMLLFLYLPRLWYGGTYDAIGALGSALTGNDDDRSRFLGSVIFFAGGIAFAFLYGLVAYTLLQPEVTVPQLDVLPALPVQINVFYPLIGLALGLAHGGVVALLMTIVVIEHHPIARYRTRYLLIVSLILSHTVFGATVMFFHTQFLQLLIGRVA